MMMGSSYKLIEEGARNLVTLESKIDTDKMKSPSFKMVLTGVGKYAYQRPQDGVYVVPIGCLRDQKSISCFLSLLMVRYDIDYR